MSVMTKETDVQIPVQSYYEINDELSLPPSLCDQIYCSSNYY